MTQTSTQKIADKSGVKSVLILISSAPKSASSAAHSSLLTVVVFLVALAIPLLGFLFRMPSLPANENRPLPPPPALVPERWAVQTFPVMFDAYFNDRAGFR